MTVWCYSPDLTYVANFKSGAKAPLLVSSENHVFQPRFCFGKILATPLGVAPCPAINASGVQTLSKLGLSYFTYPTIQSKVTEAHTKPNIKYLRDAPLIQYALLDEKFEVNSSKEVTDSWANFFGYPCLSLDYHAKDIEKIKSYLSANQCLTISCLGTGTSEFYIKQDWLNLIAYSKEVGADVIELNLSLPNKGKNEQLFYYEDAQFIATIKTLVKAAQGIPIVVKIPLIQDLCFLIKRLRQISHCEVQGISFIERVELKLSEDERALFGSRRKYMQVSGAALYALLQDYAFKACQIRDKDNLDLKLIASGGVKHPRQIQSLFDLGIDIVTAATAVMINPMWAMNYLEVQQNAEPKAANYSAVETN